MSNRYRDFEFGVTRIQVREGTQGVQYLTADQTLQPFAKSLAERLVFWASENPNQTLFARRRRLPDGTTGEWEHLSFAAALNAARNIGQALIDRGLSADRPVAILSENSLEHAMMALACIYVGVPYCPVSTAYSLVSKDYSKLRHVLETITPGLVFASDAGRYREAIKATVPDSCEIVTVNGSTQDFAAWKHTSFGDLQSTTATPHVDLTMAQIDSNTIAKFLFTSGSTKLPKGVVNTNGLWCANQQQMRQSMPVLANEKPVLVDWLPWNHTFGGNHNFGMVIYNGGTLYIDDGKPVPGLIDETLRNLREIAPTCYFNVPTGFEAIAAAMKTDSTLRKTLLSKVRMFFYAGAALAQPIWDSLHASQEQEIGQRIIMGTGLGMTESGPFGLFVTNPNVKAGYLGVPTPGLELKLVPNDGKVEVRYRGPNITPGYWRNEAATSESFDEEGFFKTGDAVLWIDPADPHQGLKFDGRIAEDFKLATGTFVSVGPLRSKLIAAFTPYVQDAVITGINRKEIGALLFTTGELAKLAESKTGDGTTLNDWASSPKVTAKFQQTLNSVAAQGTGSASRISRLVILTDPPSIDRGEVTDKGSINQRAVLSHRAELVERFHNNELSGTLVPQSYS